MKKGEGISRRESVPQRERPSRKESALECKGTLKRESAPQSQRCFKEGISSSKMNTEKSDLGKRISSLEVKAKLAPQRKRINFLDGADISRKGIISLMCEAQTCLLRKRISSLDDKVE